MSTQVSSDDLGDPARRGLVQHVQRQNVGTDAGGRSRLPVREASYGNRS